MKTERLCPHCESPNWNSNVSFLMDPPQVRCDDCGGMFVASNALEREIFETALEKEKDSKPNPVIQAELLRADAVMPSGNIYPREVLEAAVRELKPHMTMNRVLGEFNPSKEEMQVRLTDAATMVKTMYFKDDVLMADLEILSTPQGEALKKHLRAGRHILPTPRGLGVLEETEEGDHVVREYTIVTVDVHSADEDEHDEEE